MAATTFKDPSVAKMLEQVVPVRLKYSADDKEIAKKHQVLWAPTFITLTADGEIADRFLMYQGPSRFKQMVKEGLQARREFDAIVKKPLDQVSRPTELARIVRMASSRREYSRALTAARKLWEPGYREEDAARSFLSAAEVFLYGKKFKESIEMFQNAANVARTVDEEGYAYVYIGQLYGVLGDRTKAVQYSNMVLKLRGVNPNYIAYAKEYLQFLGSPK